MPVTLVDLVYAIDTSDFMRKSVYDTDNDGVVDKLKKLTDIEELAVGYDDGEIPKVDADGNSTWAEDLIDDGTNGGEW